METWKIRKVAYEASFHLNKNTKERNYGLEGTDDKRNARKHAEAEIESCTKLTSKFTCKK